MHAALRFRFGHALHPVGAGLELQLPVDILSFHAGDDFLVTAVLPLAAV